MRLLYAVSQKWVRPLSKSLCFLSCHCLDLSLLCTFSNKLQYAIRGWKVTMENIIQYMLPTFWCNWHSCSAVLSAIQQLWYSWSGREINLWRGGGGGGGGRRGGRGDESGLWWWGQKKKRKNTSCCDLWPIYSTHCWCNNFWPHGGQVFVTLCPYINNKTTTQQNKNEQEPSHKHVWLVGTSVNADRQWGHSNTVYVYLYTHTLRLS